MSQLIAVAKYSNDAAQTRSNRKLTMAPLAAAIRSMCDLGAQLQPAGISCMLVFGEGGKPENPEKNPRSREENQHKLNPLMASGPGIEPGPHWWEASALTTTPSLHPNTIPSHHFINDYLNEILFKYIDRKQRRKEKMY